MSVDNPPDSHESHESPWNKSPVAVVVRTARDPAVSEEVRLLLTQRVPVVARLQCASPQAVREWQQEHHFLSRGWQELVAPMRPRGWVRLPVPLRRRGALALYVVSADPATCVHLFLYQAAARPWRIDPDGTPPPVLTSTADARLGAELVHWALHGAVRLYVEAVGSSDGSDDAMLWMLVPQLDVTVMLEALPRGSSVPSPIHALAFLPLARPPDPLNASVTLYGGPNSSSNSTATATPSPISSSTPPPLWYTDEQALAHPSPHVLRASRGGRLQDELDRWRLHLQSLRLRRLVEEGGAFRIRLDMTALPPDNPLMGVREWEGRLLVWDRRDRVRVALRPLDGDGREWIATVLPPEGPEVRVVDRREQRPVAEGSMSSEMVQRLFEYPYSSPLSSSSLLPTVRLWAES